MRDDMVAEVAKSPFQVGLARLGLVCAPALVWSVAACAQVPPPVEPAQPPAAVAPTAPAAPPAPAVDAAAAPAEPPAPAAPPSPPEPANVAEPDPNAPVIRTPGSRPTGADAALPLPTLGPAPDPVEPVADPLSRPVTGAPPPPAAPPRPPTKEEIAREIAPNFNVARDYTRLVQCYGTADFMGAVTRVQAGRPGAPPQMAAAARQITGLQGMMQPLVLASSTLRGEARFRADYDAVARRGQSEMARSANPNAVMQAQLRVLDACQADVRRWRGGQ